MDKIEFNKILKRMDKFYSLENAKNAAARGDKILMVIMGEEGQYWVGRPVDTEKLFKAGYEYAQ